MELRSFRFSRETKLQLNRLRRRTGIGTYNVLCRWALCYSLSNPTWTDRPPNAKSKPTAKENTDFNDETRGTSEQSEVALEIDWRTLGGQYREVIVAVIKQHCIENGLGVDAKNVQNQIKLHIDSGIKQLGVLDTLKKIEDLYAINSIHTSSRPQNDSHQK